METTYREVAVEKDKRAETLKEYVGSLWYLVKWMLVSIGIGVIVGSISSIFGHVLIFANRLREQNPFIIYTLPVGGLLIVALYRGCRNTGDKGTNTVVASIQESTDIPFRTAPLIFISTTITQLCGGSAGREGAALQLGGSIAKRLGRLYHLNEDSQRTYGSRFLRRDQQPHHIPFDRV